MSIERGSTVLTFQNPLNGMARASLFYLHIYDTKCPTALIRVKHCETYFICHLFLPLAPVVHVFIYPQQSIFLPP